MVLQGDTKQLQTGGVKKPLQKDSKRVCTVYTYSNCMIY